MGQFEGIQQPVARGIHSNWANSRVGALNESCISHTLMKQTLLPGHVSQKRTNNYA